VGDVSGAGCAWVRQGVRLVVGGEGAMGFLGEYFKTAPPKKSSQGWLCKGRKRCGQQGTANNSLRGLTKRTRVPSDATSGYRSCLKGRIFF
jgi:hypothetical protein